MNVGISLIYFPLNAKTAAVCHLSSNDSAVERPNSVVNILF